MNLIGFSTGAVAFGDFKRALSLLSKMPVNSVELSALRLPELRPLIEDLNNLDLRQFRYVSFHAPSRFTSEQEPEIVAALQRVSERGWPIILHPDAIFDQDCWKPLGRAICFENMDKRKPIGRTCGELEQLFDRFPDARLCFDVGHIHQVDRTMTEGRLMAQQFHDRILQIHVSEVNTRSEHMHISAAFEFAFAKIVDVLPENAPLIIESVVPETQLLKELERARRMFTDSDRWALATD